MTNGFSFFILSAETPGYLNRVKDHVIPGIDAKLRRHNSICLRGSFISGLSPISVYVRACFIPVSLSVHDCITLRMARMENVAAFTEQ